jgi:hypothetical protein
VTIYFRKSPLFTKQRGEGGEYMKFKEGLQLTSYAVILLGVLNKEKATQRFALLRLFCFHPFSKQASFGLSNKKPLPINRQGFFFVYERFEISNQNLARDITLIVKPGETVPSFE